MTVTASLILAIVQVILRYGPTALRNTIAAINAVLQEENPTPEQIRALHIDKDPEEYFME